MVGARFWRFTVSENGSPSFVALAELAFLDASGGDITTGGAAFASSTFPGFDPAAAFDKNPGTRWASEYPAPQSLSYGFPAAAEVAGARVTWDANPAYLPSSAHAVSIAWSADGALWRVGGLVLTSGALVAGTTAIFVTIDVPVILTPGTTHVPSGAYTGPYGHVVRAPVVTKSGDYKTGLLGKGTGTVYGTTAVKGTPNAPLRARVRLIRERDGLVYRETWSDPVTGAYRFDNVDELETYTVLTYHPTRDKRAVVADGLTPEVL